MTKEELKIAKKRYWDHKFHSLKRKDKLGNQIEFRLSFEEWVSVWEQSGKWHLRGCRKGQYVMSRFNDIGHYEINNVFIQSVEENSKEGNDGRIKSHKGKPSPKRKKIRTPNGEFESLTCAASYYNVTINAISFRLKKYPDEYFYL